MPYLNLLTLRLPDLFCAVFDALIDNGRLAHTGELTTSEKQKEKEKY